MIHHMMAGRSSNMTTAADFVLVPAAVLFAPVNALIAAADGAMVVNHADPQIAQMDSALA